MSALTLTEAVNVATVIVAAHPRGWHPTADLALVPDASTPSPLVAGAAWGAGAAQRAAQTPITPGAAGAAPCLGSAAAAAARGWGRCCWRQWWRRPRGALAPVPIHCA